ncbi:CD48 antigen-like isoform X2 [Salminus brasiliensis]|uniref:CD48 antigen-like isoform X2 n=1 Tax=Salminus brasiliensis TaxID=930266 RepID=UPI003B836C28
MVLGKSFGAQIREVSKQYALVGSTVHLSLGKHRQNLIHIRWKKENLLIAKDKSTLNPDFQGKFALNLTDGSLFIKNVTKNDSNCYEAIIGEWEAESWKFHLIVEGMVSEPIIDTDRDETALNSTTDCRISVKCSADGDSVMYDCDLQICSLSKTSLSRVNITVAVNDQGNVECTASNHVSSQRNSIALSNTCSEKQSHEEEKTNFSPVLTILIACGLGGILLVGVLAIHFCRKELQNVSNQEGNTTTLYGVVHKPQTSTDNSAANNAATVYEETEVFY